MLNRLKEIAENHKKDILRHDRIASKMKTEIGGELSGIGNNVNEFIKVVTNILNKISKSKFENETEFGYLEAFISDIKSEIQFEENDQEILNIQHTFLFAIDEIQENLKTTNKFFKEA